MLIGDVNFPDELLTAHREGSLVLFAGAGVSVGSPSNYPDFKQLAKEVAQRAGKNEPGPDEPLENFFGKLKSSGVDVHSIVRDRLTNPQSKPNELHIGLLSLFNTTRDVRLVTTNFDSHFSTSAASILGSSPETYRAPALPLGHRLKGIVYLHGSVEQEPEELILTDVDFGRAYLTDGWATRFLLGLFNEYTVLFVGYSYEDTILKYLARGLPPGTERYALVRSDDNSEVWENIGVSKIAFPKMDGGDEYRALPRAIVEWAKWNRMGFLDHEERISQIVKLPPPLDQNEIDYIDDVLKKAPTARLFAEHAESPEWLRWCENRGLLDDLFDVHKQPGVLAQELASWFATKYVRNQSEDGLATVRRKGQLLSWALWIKVAWHLWRYHEKTDPTVRAKWIPVLLRSAAHVNDQNDLLELMLSTCRIPQDNQSALLLFEYLTRPEIILKDSYFRWEDRQVRFEVSLIGDEHHLNNAWQRLFQPNLGAFASALEPLLTHRLQQLHSFLSATGEATEIRDPLSDLCDAIEEQSFVLHKTDILIHAARDLMEWLLERDIEAASSILSVWQRAEAPILRRLAIHGIGKANHLTSDEKIVWVLEKGWLFAAQERHEVFQLLQAAYPSSSDAIRRRLLGEALGNLSDGDSKPDESVRSDYKVYNLLVWLSRVTPDCALALEGLQRVQEIHPDFQPSEHPDRDHWTSFGIGSPYDLEAEASDRYQEFRPEELLSKEPELIVDSLLSEGERSPVCGGIAQAVATSFEWSWKVVEALQVRAALNSDLGESIIRGWSRSRLSEDNWRVVLTLLQYEEHVVTHSKTIAELLFKGVDIPDGTMPYSLLAQAEVVAEKIWPVLEVLVQQPEDASNGATEPNQEDGRYEVTESPGGRVVNFWIYGLSKRRSEGKEEWLTLPDKCRDFFERVLNGNSDVAEKGRILLASQFRFLHSNDKDWSTRRLLPLFDWSLNESQAQQAWGGFLRLANWDAEVSQKLLPLMTPMFPLLSSQLSNLRDLVVQQLAGVFVHYGLDPAQESWLNNFLEAVEDTDRVAFASSVGHQLKSISDESRRARWEGWISRYWRERVRGIPRPLSPKELERMIWWALELEPVFDSVVDLIRTSPAPDLKDGFVYYMIKEKGLSISHPQAVATLLEHLLSAATGDSHEHHKVPEILDDLMDAHVPADVLRGIADSLLGLGSYVSPRLREYIGRT